MVLIEKNIQQATADIKKGKDYNLLIAPWKDNPELVTIISGLTDDLCLNRDGKISQNELNDKLDMILDGKYGDVLLSDTRFEGNVVHSLRKIASGEPLALRPPKGRGVSDRSGKK